MSFAAFAEFLLPTRCLGCGEAGAGGHPSAICVGCRTRLPALPGPRCIRCHQPGLPGHCTLCTEWPAAVTAARSVTRMVGPGAALIHALKYQGWTRHADYMGTRMAQLIRLDRSLAKPAAVVPLPSTPRQLRRRGFNPAGLLAEAVARTLQIPLLNALSRPSEGRRQVGLPPSERSANVRGAFAPGRDFGALTHRPVLMVDDVLTTGATAVEAASVLVDPGASEVIVLTFARALPDTPGEGWIRP